MKLLAEVQKVGIKIAVDGDKLNVEGPDDALDQFLPEIALHKAEIIDFLRPDPCDSIFAAIEEYDALIHRLCDMRGDPMAYRLKLLDARRRMAPVEIPNDLAEFKKLIGQEERDRKSA